MCMKRAITQQTVQKALQDHTRMILDMHNTLKEIKAIGITAEYKSKYTS